MAPASIGFEALGTTAVVVVEDTAVHEAAERVARRLVAEVDRACSRFRDDSDLTRVNAADGEETEVGPLLLEALAVALRAAEATAGDVDPTVGAAMTANGYDRDFALVAATSGGPGGAGPAGGWRSVRVSRSRGSVRLPAGVALDLGATAKAFAADICAREIHSATGSACLVSLGGDIALGGPPPPGGWPVRVGDDHRRPAEGDEVIALRHGGLATSSTTVRRWSAGMHHIVDPRTGAPAGGPWRTVTVAAASCADANTASTAAIVRGESAPAWLEELGLPARLVSHGGRIVRTGGWPEAPR